MKPLGLEVRAGCHTGEIELLGADVGGIAVHIGARVAALAGPPRSSSAPPSRTSSPAPDSSSRTAASTRSRACRDRWHVYAVTCVMSDKRFHDHIEPRGKHRVGRYRRTQDPLGQDRRRRLDRLPDIGRGPLTLIFTNSMYSHLEVYWELPQFARFMNRLAASVRVLNFDRRGTGMSDRVARLLALESRMDDVDRRHGRGRRRARRRLRLGRAAPRLSRRSTPAPTRTERPPSSSTAGSRRAGLPTSPGASPLRIRTPTWPA